METIRYFNSHLKFLIWITIFLFLSCSQYRKHEMVISANMLYGEWSLKGGEKYVNYPDIEFRKDSTAVLYSQADTIYRFTFYTRNDSLYLVDINGKIYVNRIKEFTNKTIVFDGIADVDKEQTFKR
jgi:hypothetical protein